MRYMLIALLLASCASNQELIITSGSSVCTAGSLAECERLSKIGDTLHTPEMEAAIKAARR